MSYSLTVNLSLSVGAACLWLSLTALVLFAAVRVNVDYLLNNEKATTMIRPPIYFHYIK